MVLATIAGAASVRAAPAPSATDAVLVRVGMSCVVADGWWSLDPSKPEQPEPVKVVALASLLTGDAGAWVQPLRGKMADHQYHVSLRRLTECR